MSARSAVLEYGVVAAKLRSSKHSRNSAHAPTLPLIPVLLKTDADVG